MDFNYVFKWGSEIFWAVVIAVAIAVIPILAGADPDVIFADPKAWAAILGGAVARAAVAGGLLAFQGLLRRLVESRNGAEG